MNKNTSSSMTITNLRAELAAAQAQAFSLKDLYEIHDAFDNVLVELEAGDSKGTHCFAQAEAAQAKVRHAISAALTAARK